MSLPEIKLFNTLTRSVETFFPLKKGEVTLYCCGPTVYNFQHIGNLRTYLFEDFLVKILRYAGYKVQHVMNITDVGHLVSDADDGEDKMLVAAKREGKRSEDIATYYTNIFFEHCAWLNIKKPDVVCKATEHISEMIALIERLLERGFAYQSGGNVYFDVSKFEAYPELAKLSIEQLQAGARIEVDIVKRNPLDFALWFTKSKFENQELQWESPWGRGYPGWHIECSAMAMKYLGEHFDIHCGGIDHIPVHHTNERAQSEGATGKPFVNIWMHGGFLLTNKEKMSKSTGGFLTLDVLKEKNIDPLAYRLFCMSGSYRQELNWSTEAIEGAAQTLERLKNTVSDWREKGAQSEKQVAEGKAKELLAAFDAALFNDLGMPKALAVLHETVQSQELEVNQKLTLLERFDEVLCLGVRNWKVESFEIPEEVSNLLAKRQDARAKRNWQEADEARDRILALGFEIKDTADGAKLIKKK